MKFKHKHEHKAQDKTEGKEIKVKWSDETLLLNKSSKGKGVEKKVKRVLK